MNKNKMEDSINEFFDEKAFQKHIKKIKFFWRGTNFNYPYTYVKLIPQREKEEKEVKKFWKIQEFSKKKINPTESFYN